MWIDQLGDCPCVFHRVVILAFLMSIERGMSSAILRRIASCRVSSLSRHRFRTACVRHVLLHEDSPSFARRVTGRSAACCCCRLFCVQAYCRVALFRWLAASCLHSAISVVPTSCLRHASPCCGMPERARMFAVSLDADERHAAVGVASEDCGEYRAFPVVVVHVGWSVVPCAVLAYDGVWQS